MTEWNPQKNGNHTYDFIETTFNDLGQARLNWEMSRPDKNTATARFDAYSAKHI